MINFGCDTIVRCEVWNDLYNRLAPDKKVAYFSPHYYRAYTVVENYPSHCFWGVNHNGDFLFYPYMKRSINKLGYNLNGEYYDVCGAYGYNGPIGKTEDGEFIHEYNTRLQEELVKQNVVTELVRYCPIPDNRLYHTYTEQIDVLDNVFVDVGMGIENLWMNSYEKNLRTSIRKGASYGLQSIVLFAKELSVDDLQLAYNIYCSTMQRNKADDFYYFGIDFLKRLHAEMQDKLLLIVTFHENIAISFELLICDGVLSFAILGGTLSDYYRLNPNTYQKNELFIGLIRHGFKLYSMGGGVSRADNLYAYKKSFNKRCENPFYIGVKVHNKQVYDELQSQWRNSYPKSAAENANKLQGYRIMHA